MKMRHSTFIIALVVLAGLLLPGCVQSKPTNKAERVVIDYYFLNTCSACDPMKDLDAFFADTFDADVTSKGIIVKEHNILAETEQKEWEAVAAQHGYDDNAYPAILMEGTIYPVGRLEKDQQEIIQKTLDTSDMIFPPNASKIVYFHSPGCTNCDKVQKQILDQLPNEITLEDGTISTISLIHYSLSSTQGISLMREYSDWLAIDPEEQITPLIIIGYAHYTHQTASFNSIIHVLKVGNGLKTPVLTAEDGTDNNASKQSLIGVFLVGLINGLNPCAISMFLMLLSLLALEPKKIWRIGVSFAIGKFIGFFLLGTLLYSVIDAINFKGIQTIIGLLLAAFSLVMIILNLYDYFAAKSQRYGDIKLQLPERLRAFNHRLLKSDQAKHMGILLGLVMGILFSGGEFLCTGQIYLATIVNAIHTSTQSSPALLRLCVYSFAFIIPLIILVALAASGKRVLQISEFFRKNVPAIKLLNVGIFTLILIMTIIYIL